MARLRDPFFSNCSMMSPTAFLRTASGLTIVKVRCNVFIFRFSPRSIDLRFSLRSRGYSHCGGNGLADLSGRPRHPDAGCFHSLDLFFSSSSSAGDNRTGVAHAASGRRGLACDESYDRLSPAGLACDESYDRLSHARFDVLSRSLFGIAADFTDHDDGFSLRVSVEQFHRVPKTGTYDWISADADCCGLSDTARSQLINRLISQRAGARHDTNRAFKVNASGHNSNLAFSRRDYPGAIWPDQP